jgi:hypothetical protein
VDGQVQRSDQRDPRLTARRHPLDRRNLSAREGGGVLASTHAFTTRTAA